MSSRQLLQEHTSDMIRPRWDNHQQAMRGLVSAAQDPETSDEAAEAAALAFVLDWAGHPTYRKTARYGVILYTLRHRPEVAELVEAFSEVVDNVGRTSGGIEGWYRNYTGGCDERLF